MEIPELALLDFGLEEGAAAETPSIVLYCDDLLTVSVCVLTWLYIPQGTYVRTEAAVRTGGDGLSETESPLLWINKFQRSRG